MARTEKREIAKRDHFLAALGETASVTKACELVGLPRRTVYHWRRANPDFAHAWDDALDMGTEALEDEAIRRAYHGTERPIFQGKQLVGYVRDYSDTLLIFMLKARRPEKYRERSQTELTSPTDQAVVEVIRSPRSAARSPSVGSSVRRKERE